MTTCRECGHHATAIQMARVDLARVARMCARNPSPKNLALVTRAKEDLAKQQRFADDHQRTEHGVAA